MGAHLAPDRAGINAAFAAPKLGHASPAAALSVYAHPSGEAASVGRAREYPNGQVASLTGRSGG
jgi:hypothetical protein